MAGPNAKRKTFFPSDASKLPTGLLNPVNIPSMPKPTLRAQSPAQKGYIRKMTKRQHDILFVTGPAGTGKTYPAVVWAIMEYQAGRASKIIITRPNVGAGDDLGFLPGNLIEKMSPWCAPVLDIFKEFMPVHEVEMMIRREELELAPMVYMRGRTLKNAIVIVDEAQNSTTEQMKMLLTRIGEGSMMIITGDIEQHDRPGSGTSGLQDILARISRRDALPELPIDETVVNFADYQEGHYPEAPAARERIGQIKFGKGDVVRHPVIEEVLDLYA